jgi:hypothetical protein
LQLALAVGIDHAKHGFGLRQVDAAGQKRAEGEFARFGDPGAGRADGGQSGGDQRRRAERVNFRGDLPRVAALGGPVTFPSDGGGNAIAWNLPEDAGSPDVAAARTAAAQASSDISRGSSTLPLGR